MKSEQEHFRGEELVTKTAAVTGTLPPLESSRYRDLFRNKHFLRIWIAQITALVAVNMVNFALITRIFEITKSSLAVSVLMAILTVPPLLLGAFGGAVADAMDRRKILLASNVLRAVLVLIYLGIIHQEYQLVLIPFYLVAFLIGVVNQFFIPAETAALAQLIPKRLQLKANALFSFMLFGSFVIGASIASPLIQGFGTASPYFLGAVLYAIAAVAVFGLPTMKGTGLSKIALHRIERHLLREIVESWRAVSDKPSLKFPIIQMAVIQATIGMLVVLAPGFIDQVLKLPVAQAGILIAPAGVGFVIGGIAVGLFGQKRKRSRMITGGFAAFGVTLLAVALSRDLSALVSLNGHDGPAHIATLFLLLVVIFIAGFEMALVYVPSQTLLTENTASSVRGRVFGLLNMVVNVGSTLPLLIAGGLADFFTPKQVIAAVGGLVIFGSVVLRRVWKGGY